MVILVKVLCLRNDGPTVNNKAWVNGQQENMNMTKGEKEELKW